MKSKSTSTVEKITGVSGSLAARDLYVYLPAAAVNEPERRFPVIFMQDGQNCFARYAEDSYTGETWAADLTADQMIADGTAPPFLIVGVSHGGENRILEYLPPYSTYEKKVHLPATGGHKRYKHAWIPGEANKTAKYYQDELLPFIAARYPILTDRQHIATCGSSMGGLFATYLAWEFPTFARHHAALSASFWITADPSGSLAIANRIRRGQPRDIRFWLDSGTEDRPGHGDDNSPGVVEVRNAFRDQGFTQQQVHYLLDEGAIHNEAAWARRLPRVFGFLTAEWDEKYRL